MQENKRRLKIYSVSGQDGKSRPQLILQGQWLSVCGFQSGGYVVVECEDGKLTISREMPVKVAVIGSRSIKAIDLATYLPNNCGLIVSGGAKGVDTLAERYAKDNGIELLIIRPDYEKYGKAAPIRRNALIVDNVDLVLAFWDGESRGTKYTIDYAKKSGKLVKIIVPNQRME